MACSCLRFALSWRLSLRRCPATAPSRRPRPACQQAAPPTPTSGTPRFPPPTPPCEVAGEPWQPRPSAICLRAIPRLHLRLTALGMPVAATNLETGVRH
jgi:hypothetical protein